MSISGGYSGSGDVGSKISPNVNRLRGKGQVDLMLQLGFFRNIDLMNKGIYKLQIALVQPKDCFSFAPINMFSSPSDLGSFVEDQKIPIGPQLSMSQLVDESEMVRTKSSRSSQLIVGGGGFHSRSLIIRYKDESYELNDGVNWQVSCSFPPPSDTDEEDDYDDSGPILLSFELLYSPLLDEPIGNNEEEENGREVSFNLLTEVHRLIPVDQSVSFCVVATQVLVLPLEQISCLPVPIYYPISFGGYYIAKLDCIIHCSHTALNIPVTPKNDFEGLKLIKEYLERCKEIVRTLDSLVKQRLHYFCSLIGDGSISESTLALMSAQDAVDVVTAFLTDQKRRWQQYWTQLVLILPNSLQALLPLVQEKYLQQLRRFWEKQVLVHVCSSTGTSRIQPDQDFDLLHILIELLRDEDVQRHQRHNRCIRGLPIFDVLMQQSFERLPHILIQQYVGPCDMGTLHQPAFNMNIPRNFCNKVNDKKLEYPIRLPLSSHAQQLRNVLSILRLSDDPTPAGSLFLARPSNSSPLSSLLLSSNHTRPLEHSMPTVQCERSSEKNIDFQRFPSLRPLFFVAPQEKFSDIEEVQNKKLSKPVECVGVHLVFLQHGFLARSSDMQLIGNALCIELGLEGSCGESDMKLDLHYLQSNEGQERYLGIEEMGKRLAWELRAFCAEKYPDLLESHEGDVHERKVCISFIGHSMGALIIRSALKEPFLVPLLDYLQCFVSLAAPHAGALFAESQLVSTGMWALSKWKKYPCLQELALVDAKDKRQIRSCLLFRLAQPALNILPRFRKVILVHSPKDRYVPAYSARLQINARIEADAKTGPTITALILNIITGISSRQLVRVTLDNVEENVELQRDQLFYDNLWKSKTVGVRADSNSFLDVDNALGRTAHVCYVENALAVRVLILAILPFFRIDVD